MSSRTNGLDQSTGPGPGAPAWGVVLLAHGSQRGSERSECSCAWVDSGSRQPAWCLNCPSPPIGLRRAADQLQALLGLRSRQLVLSCLEFIEPHPDQAVRILEERGVRHVVLVPFLLGNGKHATLELEELVEGFRVDTPNVQIYLAEGLGADPLLADLVVQRLQEMDSPSPFLPEADRTAGVLLVKAGTKTIYDDCRWLVELGRSVEDRLGTGYAVEVAQSHYGDPTMEAATEYLVEERGASSVTYVPYVFFPGLILKRNFLGGMARLQEKYPDLPMAATPPLGADPRVLAVVAERVRKLWVSTRNPAL
jgi:sirohydrochlorin ferrochelatase